MTNVVFYAQNGNITGFKIEGHSGYGQAGSDIVCAAISSVAQATIMGLEEVANVPMDVDVKEGFLKATLASHSQKYLSKSSVLLKTMKLALEDIAGQYSDYMSVQTA